MIIRLSITNLGAKVVIFFDIRKRVRIFCNELIKNDEPVI